MRKKMRIEKMADEEIMPDTNSVIDSMQISLRMSHLLTRVAKMGYFELPQDGWIGAGLIGLFSKSILYPDRNLDRIDATEDLIDYLSDDLVSKAGAYLGSRMVAAVALHVIWTGSTLKQTLRLAGGLSEETLDRVGTGWSEMSSAPKNNKWTRT